jgi:hypothetical protein
MAHGAARCRGRVTLQPGVSRVDGRLHGRGERCNPRRRHLRTDSARRADAAGTRVPAYLDRHSDARRARRRGAFRWFCHSAASARVCTTTDQDSAHFAHRRRGAPPARLQGRRAGHGGDDAGVRQRSLACSHSRMVTDRGVYVCPILIDSPDARLGSSLVEAQRSYGLRHGACLTCYQAGALCANVSSRPQGA